MNFKPIVICYCALCDKSVERLASEFDTDEKLTCENCGCDYTDVGLAIVEDRDNHGKNSYIKIN
jgi:hypothetical protein